MLIHSQMGLAELQKLMSGASVREAKFMRDILVDEMRESTEDYSNAEFSEAVETAKRFAEENPDLYKS